MTRAGDDKILQWFCCQYARGENTYPPGTIIQICDDCLQGRRKKPIRIMSVPEGATVPQTDSNFEFFNGVVRDRVELIQNVLLSKGKEYSRGNDRFSNFKTAARRLNVTPERALLGMREKHEVSIVDIINDLDGGILPSEELLEEKLGDSINYLILLEGLIKERIRGKQ